MTKQKIYRRQYSRGNMRRGENMKAILEELKDGALLTLELLDLVFGSYRRSYKSALGIVEYKRPKKQTQYELEREKQQVFYTLLNKLKREGFVSKKQSKKGTIWSATEKGLKKLKALFGNKRLQYKVEDEKKLKIITFDIPEALKRKRDWLREILRFLEFHMLHKSVWIGTSKIPEDFLLDLRDAGLLNYVHILGVGAQGTVKEFRG